MYSPYFIVKNRVLDGFHNSDIFETDMLLEFCKTTRSICKKTIFFFQYLYRQTCQTKWVVFAPAAPITLATRLQVATFWKNMF